MEEVQAAQMMQQQCKGGGVDMKVQPMSQTEYYGSGDNQPWLTVPMGSTQWAMRPVPEQFFTPCLYSDGVWNSAHFKNAQFDSLGKQYTSTLDEATRKDLARQLTTLQMDETPLLIPYWMPGPPRHVEERLQRAPGRQRLPRPDYGVLRMSRVLGRRP